jgi:hypothetical protein
MQEWDSAYSIEATILIFLGIIKQSFIVAVYVSCSKYINLREHKAPSGFQVTCLLSLLLSNL